MQIEFEVNIDDCFALNQHLIKNASIMKSAVRKGQIWWAIGPFAGVTLLAVFRKIPFEKALILIAVVTAILSTPVFFLYPLYFKWQNRKFIKKSCESEKSKGIIGKHLIEVTDENFREKTDFNDTYIPWKGIDRIETTQNHTFIFVNEITAYIVPRHSLSAESYNSFMKEINGKHNNNIG